MEIHKLICFGVFCTINKLHFMWGIWSMIWIWFSQILIKIINKCILYLYLIPTSPLGYQKPIPCDLKYEFQILFFPTKHHVWVWNRQTPYLIPKTHEPNDPKGLYSRKKKARKQKEVESYYYLVNIFYIYVIWFIIGKIIILTSFLWWGLWQFFLKKINRNNMFQKYVLLNNFSSIFKQKIIIVVWKNNIKWSICQ